MYLCIIHIYIYTYIYILCNYVLYIYVCVCMPTLLYTRRTYKHAIKVHKVPSMPICFQDSVEHGAALLAVGRICAAASAAAAGAAAAAALPQKNAMGRHQTLEESRKSVRYHFERLLYVCVNIPVKNV